MAVHLETRQGLTCDLKTLWEAMHQRGWLSTSHTRLIRSARRHEGQVRVAEPNPRLASDITIIRAWDGRKGRLAIGSDGVGLALCHADHRRGSGRNAARGDIPAIWGDTSPRAGNRVSQRQRA